MTSVLGVHCHYFLKAVIQARAGAGVRRQAWDWRLDNRGQASGLGLETRNLPSMSFNPQGKGQ